MGLEKLLRSQYGTDPSIDLDKQLAQARVLTPMKLDFQMLADGVRKNNMGLGGIRVLVAARIENGRVIVVPTGQTLPLKTKVDDAPAAKRWLKVIDPQDPAKTTLEVER